MKALLLLLTWAMGDTVPQDQVKVGSLAFVPPAGWKAASSSGPKAAVYSAPGLASGKTCQVTVFPDEIAIEGARAWFDKKWTSVAAKSRQMLRMSDVADQSFGPVQAILRSGAYKDGSGEAYVLLVGLSVEGHKVLVSYDANDYALMEKNQDDVFDMFDSFDLLAAGEPEAGKPAKPATVTPKNQTIPKIQAPGKPMQDRSPERLARLSEIASALQDPKTNAVELITEAAKLCGFEIWKEDRTKIADPTGSPPLHLAVTDVEIKEYAAMYRSGHSVALADLAGSIDVLYKEIGATDSSADYISRWLGTGIMSNNPSVRALTAWLQDLGSSRRSNAASGIGNGYDQFDPIQALFILRVVSEEICVPLRKAIRKSEPNCLLVSLQPEFQGEAPGWAGDAFVGGVTGLWDSVIGLLDAGESTVGKVNKNVGRANAILSIIKFIATYCFLKSELTVEAPGQPLIRTKNMEPGQGTRTMVAKFYIDGTRVTDWMKDHREVVALAGLDLDMPKTGALKNVETSWDVRQSGLSARKLIQTVRGSAGLDKIKTDENGEARVTWEGAPQTKVLDPKKVMPVLKTVLIIVTPQVKEVEMKQDLLDAVTGAIGINGGGVAFVTPLMEVLYRMKWKGAVSKDLQIRDWKEAETIGQFKVDIQASGRFYDQGSYEMWTLDRLLDFTDVGMMAIGGEAPPPEIDANVLKNLPEIQRQQILAGMKQMAELAKRRQFSGQDPGRAVMKIKDHRSSSSETCTVAETSSDTWNGNFDLPYSKTSDNMMFEVFVDIEKKTATVVGQAAVKVQHVHTSKDGKEPTETTREETSMTIFDGLEMKNPFDKSKGGMVIALKETPVIDMPGTTNYYGVETIPFTWGKDFKGNAHISYSVTRKSKPKAPGLTFAEAQQLNMRTSALSAFLNRPDLTPQRTNRTEAQEMAMCYPTSVVLRGQLKHQAPTVKRAGRR